MYWIGVRVNSFYIIYRVVSSIRKQMTHEQIEFSILKHFCVLVILLFKIQIYDFLPNYIATKHVNHSQPMRYRAQSVATIRPTLYSLQNTIFTYFFNIEIPSDVLIDFIDFIFLFDAFDFIAHCWRLYLGAFSKHICN